MLRKIRKLWEFVRYSSFWIFIHIGILFSANPGDIVITEFNFQSEGDIYEYIEIFNTTSDNINLMDWKIEVNGNKYSIDDQKAVIIRTLPNLEDEITCRDYNTKHNAFFSNEAVKYLRICGVKYLVVDLPSIDRFDDGGTLENHRIFWDLDGYPNYNIITELALIKNEIKDGKYLLSLNILNMSLDASPCRPIIYSVLKMRNTLFEKG